MERTGKYLKLHLGDIYFILYAQDIEVILSDYILTQIPSDHPWLYGVLYYKKKMIPVVQLAQEQNQASIVALYRNEDEEIAYLASGLDDFLFLTQETMDNYIKQEENELAFIVLNDEPLYFPNVALMEKNVDKINS